MEILRATWDAWRIASHIHERNETTPGAPARERAAAARVPPHVATVLDFQRSLGNRATAAILARDPKPAGTQVEEIKIGDNVSLELAQEAQQLVKKGPIDDKTLRTLRAKALKGDDTLTPDERIFLTALMDAGNAKVLVDTKLAKGTKVSFSFPRGTTTRHVADLDRPTADADTQLPDTKAAEEAIERQLVRFAGGDRGLEAKARSVMAFARREGVAAGVVSAAIASASDGTAGDLVAAASVYAIGKAAGHPMAAEVLAGRVKVDLRKISTAGRYNPVGRPDSKGDTLSVPHVPDPENLDDRGTVIHELTHAGQDAGEKPSPLRRLREPKDLEQEAYTVEADYELKQVAKLSDAKARATAVGQLVKTWGGERSGAMAVATKKDPKLLPMAQELSKAVRKINKKVADEFDALLGGEEDDAVRALRAAIKSIVAEIDGLAGETDLDTSATFSSGKAAVSRRVETTYGIRFARFKVGVELTTELAHAGWAATIAGPLDDAGLRKLHAIALSHWGSTIDDNERMFMAALMNAENAKSLHLEHPYGFFADDQISFTAASITAANRHVVEDVGRDDRPADRSDPNAPHIEGDTRELDRQIREMAGSFAGVAQSALKLADKVGVSHASVYFAMLNGASDSTPDDRAYAGITYVVAVEAGLDVAPDILRRRLKIDAVPRLYLEQLAANALGAYHGRGATLKGDTLYLPWDTDPELLGARATIVHELTHAKTDRDKVELTNAQDEARSFEAEMRYVLAHIQPLTGPARAQAISEAAKGSGKLEVLAALGAIRDDQDPPDPDAVTVVDELNKAVTDGLPDIAPYLAMPILRLYDAEVKEIAKRYAKLKPSGRASTDGFGGESALD